MKVLLLQDIKKIGVKNEVVAVSDGYARNFLIPRGLARIADQKALKDQASIKASEEAFLSDIGQLVQRLSGEVLEFAIKTGGKGEVFESVSAVEIKKELENKGYKNIKVNLPHSLKNLGEYKVEVSFPRGVKGEVRVAIKSL